VYRNSIHLQRADNPSRIQISDEVVLALFAPVALVQFQRGDQEGEQIYGVQPHHLLCCDALGLDHSWYEAPSAPKAVGAFRPLERGFVPSIS
jgi:hypothetical protein